MRELMAYDTLPSKTCFSASEIADLLKVKVYEINFWEAEFAQIRSQKTKHGQRLYRKEDLVLFSAIKHLLHDKKFTLAGARRAINEANFIAHELQSVETRPDNAEELLLGVSSLIPEELSYDEQTHQIYQSCQADIETVASAVAVEPHHIGEIIADGLVEQAHKTKEESRLTKLEYEKTLASLIASKKSLSEVLTKLEQYAPSDFWCELKK